MNQHTYIRLDPEMLNELQTGDVVFLTMKNAAVNLTRAAGTVFLDDECDMTLVVPVDGHAVAVISHLQAAPLLRVVRWDSFVNLSRNADCSAADMTLEVRNSVFVKTPDGIVRASAYPDIEYPGIRTDLIRDDDTVVSLSLTEYISGGEGTCDFDPAHMSEMVRQDKEVPPERRRPAETPGKHDAWYSKDRVTAGLVTRTWPDETHNEDNHLRTFHVGYNGKDD